MRRFVISLIVYTALATILWLLAHAPLASATIEFAKVLHAFVGSPAPYLIVEVADYFWLAPPAQVLVGLTLASHWLPWKRRLFSLAVGLALFWFLTALTIIAQSSPYLGPSSARTWIAICMTKGLLLVIPITLWLLLTGVPPIEHFLPQQKQDKPHSSKGTASNTAPGRLWLNSLLATAVCLLLPIALWILEASDPANVRRARREVMHALTIGSPRTSILATANLGKIQRQTLQQEDMHIHYLLGRLCLEAGDMQGAKTNLLSDAIKNPHIRLALAKEVHKLEQDANQQRRLKQP